MSDLKEKREIAQSEARDKTTKIIAGMVPMGSAAYELLTTIVVPLHEKKRREFIHDLASRLKKLEDQGQIDFEELGRNEEFNTITTKAILLAQQNHQKEKLEALRNIVVNASEKLTKEVIEFDEVDYFLSILNRISPYHILILKKYQDPSMLSKGREAEYKKSKEDPLQAIGSTPKSILFVLNSDLVKKENFVSLCWNDFMTFNLVKSVPFEELIEPGVKSLITDFGNKFLDMIEREE
ncbi:MAG: hypothetical protein WD604_13575 [Balneolaceae bacterium]